MDESAPIPVANSELLVKAMGHWPSFHDAHVLSASHEGNCCKALLHVFRITDQIDEQGYIAVTDHHRVCLTMTGVSECSLPSGYGGDTLFELLIERAGEAVAVTFDSTIDSEDSWSVTCKEVTLSDVLPRGPRGETAL